MPLQADDFHPVEDRQAALQLGLRHALTEPAMILFFAFLSFGVIAADAGFSTGEALLSTSILWALPAQLVHAESAAAGAGLAASVVAILLTNLRFLPMIMSLLPRLTQSRSVAVNVSVSHLITSTTWAWCMNYLGHLPMVYRVSYFLSLSLCCWVFGVLGTFLGISLSEFLPPLVKTIVLFLAPLYMLLLLADVRGHHLVALLTGAACGCIMYPLSHDWYLPIAALVGGSSGFIFKHIWVTK